MSISVAWLKERAFGVSPEGAMFERPGFNKGLDEAVRQKLHRIPLAFLHGYNTAVRDSDIGRLGQELDKVDLETRGFAYEGAAMALALFDYLTPWQKNRLQTFVNGPAKSYVYLAYIGAGWAYAKLRVGIDKFIARTDPLLGWLAVDGYGFHEGFFRWDRTITRKQVPARFKGYYRRAFDQGLGRSLWFVHCASPQNIAGTIGSFPVGRQADMWSGIGLACAYAGSVEPATIETLRELAGPYVTHMAQGATFAAKARHNAGNMAPHTELACEMLCGMSAESAVMIMDAGYEQLPADADEPAYEVWRQRVRSQFATVALSGTRWQ